MAVRVVDTKEDARKRFELFYDRKSKRTLERSFTWPKEFQEIGIGRDVAVKILPEAFGSDPERLRRFDQEARAAGSLNHPNVVAIFDVGELAMQVCNDHRPAVAAAGASVTVAVRGAPLLMVGDRDRLHQVLSNLIGNALVHARGAPIEVTVAARGGDVVITVADDGPGIPADQLPRVFERQWQGREGRGGAGLGLGIVKRVAEAHHGTVAVTSPPGRGARFEVVLPRDGSQLEAAP